MFSEYSLLSQAPLLPPLVELPSTGEDPSDAKAPLEGRSYEIQGLLPRSEEELPVTCIRPLFVDLITSCVCLFLVDV